LVQDAQEPDAQGDEAQDETQGANRRLLGRDAASLSRDHLQAEQRHPEGLAAETPRIGEVDEFPYGDRDDGDNLVVGQGDLLADEQFGGHRQEGDRGGEESPRDPDIGGEGGQSADGAGIVALPPDGQAF
jgi:hypothetical protein